MFSIQNVYFAITYILDRSNKLSGKRLLGFIPQLQPKSAYRKSVFVARFKRSMMRACMKFVVKQIVDLGPPFLKNMRIGSKG